jgi:hypothetical protein
VLLGQVDHAHAPFADLFEQLVGADLGAGLFQRSWADGRWSNDAQERGSSDPGGGTLTYRWSLIPCRTAAWFMD